MEGLEGGCCDDDDYWVEVWGGEGREGQDGDWQYPDDMSIFG